MTTSRAHALPLQAALPLSMQPGLPLPYFRHCIMQELGELSAVHCGMAPPLSSPFSATPAICLDVTRIGQAVSEGALKERSLAPVNYSRRQPFGSPLATSLESVSRRKSQTMQCDAR
eukprot:scaffold225641_cov30-Tisochrysis_lutea.AAC.4